MESPDEKSIRHKCTLEQFMCRALSGSERWRRSVGFLCKDISATTALRFHGSLKGSHLCLSSIQFIPHSCDYQLLHNAPNYQISGCYNNISQKIHGPSEVVLRCQRRKRSIRDAVKYRKDFALSHFCYIQTLREMGYALWRFSDRDLADIEILPINHSDTCPHDDDGDDDDDAASQISHNSSSTAGPIKPLQKLPNLSAKSFTSSPMSSHGHSSSMRKPESDVLNPTNKSYVQADKLGHNNDNLSTTLKSPNVNSIYAHKKQITSPFGGTVNSSPTFFSPERELSDDMFYMNSIPPSPSIRSPGLSLHDYNPSSASASASPQSSSWDPFNIFFFSPMRPRTRHNSRKGGKQQEWEQYQEEIARDEGMPLLEEYQISPKMEQLEENSFINMNPIKTYEKVNVMKVKTGESEKKGILRPENDSKNHEKVRDKTSGNGGLKGYEAKKRSLEDMKDKVKILSKIATELNDVFVLASKSGIEVSAMLEIEEIGDQHMNSSYFNGIIDFESDEDAVPCSHSLTLETLYTWEKKLYKEVKIWDNLRFAYARKCKQYNNIIESELRDSDLMHHTRASMESLNSQLHVAFDAISSTAAKIEQVTHEDLYPQLMQLLKRLKTMWKGMLRCHAVQKMIALQQQAVEDLGVRFKASDMQINTIIQLEHELGRWHQHLFLWVKSQQRYIASLLDWIRLCHMEPENTISGSPPISKIRRTPMYVLARNWDQSLTWLTKNVEASSNTMKEFAEALHALQVSESEELRLRHGHGHGVNEEILNVPEHKDLALSSLQEHLFPMFETLCEFALITIEEYGKLYKDAKLSTPKRQS